VNVKTIRELAGTLALLASLAPLAQTQQQSRIYRDGSHWTEELTGSLPASKNLKIKVDMGSVRVVGGSQSSINYVVRNRAFSSSEEQARREFDSYKISAWIRGDTAYINCDAQGSRSRKLSGEFLINVPRQMEWVKIETEGGNVSATGLAGRAEATSGGGTINLDDIGGAVNAETSGGSIDIGSVGGELNLHTGGGSIVIRSAKGKIKAESGGGSVVLTSGLQGAVLETGGGSIKVDQCSGRVKATTAGGSIDLGHIGGPAEIATGGGSIRVSSASGAVRAETSGGSIELNGVSSARAETGGGGIVAKFVSSTGERTDSVLETSAGDITVYLAQDLPITIRASIDVANGHFIQASDFPGIRITSEGGDYGPKTVTAEGQLNGGGPVLKVRTTTGDIVFRRASR
jgi:DUF4097 and DUF4098 domain-containing protein YvlB